VRVRATDATVRFRRVLMTSVAPPAPRPTRAAGARAPSVDPALPERLALPGPDPIDPAAPAVAPREVKRTPLWDTLDRFTEPGWPAGTAPRFDMARLRSTLDALRRESPGWVASAPAASQPARRLAVASFVLDLLYTQNDPFLWTDRQPAHDLIDWAAATLGAGPPTAAERLWYVGAIALSERGGAPDPLSRLVRRGLERFPGEPRFLLARAVVEDLRTWPEERDTREFSVSPAVAAALVARYEEAAAVSDPDVRDEARMRLAYFELRRGRAEPAVAMFETIEPRTTDPTLRYWLALLHGRALEEAGRTDDAIARYEEALDVVPGATSARAALVAGLAAARRTSDAARLASIALTTPAAPVDPWTMYVLPDMRFWPAVTAELRKAVSR
jgi:hypothetical protein